MPKLWNGITGNGFQTNAQIAQTAALNAPSTITETQGSGTLVTNTSSSPAATTPNLQLGPGMQSAIDAEKSNGLVDLATSALGLGAATPGVIPEMSGAIPGAPAFMLGLTASGASVNNDSSSLNLSINGASTVFGVMSTFGTGTVAAVGTGGGLGVAAGATAWSFSNFTSNIITSVFAPPPEAMNINGTTVQQPDLSDIPQ